MSALPADPVEAESSAAEALVLDGQIAEARPLWRSILARHGEAGVRQLRIRGHQHFRRGNWAAAATLYTLLAENHHTYGFLRRRAAWCLQHGDQFLAEHLTPGHRDRILGALRTAFPQAVDVTSSLRPGGLNSIKNFRHVVRDAEGHVLAQVFEKSFVGTEAKGFARAKLLFETHSSAAILAPRYFGTIEFGPFRSILQEQAVGERPTHEEWPEVQRRVAAHLWQQPPSQAIRTALCHTRIRNLLERLHSPGVFVNAISWWPAVSIRDWLRIAGGRSYVDVLGRHLSPRLRDRLKASRPTVCDRLRRLPLFVMHGDMHQANVLLDRGSGSIRTIDWDRWTIEPVGAGLALDPSAGEQHLLAEGPVRRGRFAAAPLPLEPVMLAAALWNMRESYRAGQFTRIEPFAELVAHYAGR